MWHRWADNTIVKPGWPASGAGAGLRGAGVALVRRPSGRWGPAVGRGTGRRGCRGPRPGHRDPSAALVPRPGWGDRHRLALISGALTASMAAGFLANHLAAIDLLGKVILNLAALAGLLLLHRRLRDQNSPRLAVPDSPS